MNNKIKILTVMLVIMLSIGCKNGEYRFDASGVFEATEIMVSAEAAGRLERFDIREGDRLERGQFLGNVDSVQLYLKKLQVIAAKKAANARKPDVEVQISATKEQIVKAELEKKRVENLFLDKVATQKQLDDASSQLNVLKRTLNAQKSALNISVNSLNVENESFDIQIAQLNDQIAKCNIVNPIEGTVLNKYSEENELVIFGRPLYKIADVKNMFLRVYAVAGVVDKITVGQDVTVSIWTNKTERTYHGKVSWIASKAEFTPKTVQTKDERENLVYAVKIAVENTDGLLKIGMYGDAKFKNDN
ncbi:MAG: efflux RND transporter periplasmic adaptor subunit [Prevotellaceae bacterium]|jgi:HlyD family secretion protein|nr:efflux RND transporter periplasmic adaptor subunit [Prevotellaceae bacterium]